MSQVESHIHALLLFQLEVLFVYYGDLLDNSIVPQADTRPEALDQILAILTSMSKQQRQTGILLTLEWSVHAGKSEPSLFETHIAKYIVAEVLIAYFDLYLYREHSDVPGCDEGMETEDYLSIGSLQAIIDSCFRVFCIHYEMVKRCQALCRSKNSAFNRLFSSKASGPIHLDQIGCKDTQNDRILDSMTHLWKKLLGCICQISVQLIHDRFLQSIRGSFGCGLETNADAKPISSSKIVQTCDSDLLCYMIQCYSELSFDPFLVNNCRALDAQNSEYASRGAHKLKQVANFLRILQGFTTKAYCYLVRRAALQVLSEVLTKESHTLSQKLYRWYCHSSKHRQLKLWYSVAIFDISANVSEWCSCLFDLHSLARQHSSSTFGTRLSKEKKLLYTPAWALRVAVMSLAPNNLFYRFWSEDFNQITRIQLRNYSSLDPPANFTKEYVIHDKNSRAIAESTKLIQSIGILFVQILQRDIVSDKTSSGKEFVDCLNRMQSWLCDGPWRRDTLDHESYTILGHISCAILCYQGTCEHIERLLFEKRSSFDERSLLGIQSLSLYHNLASRPSWQYIDQNFDNPTIQPLLWVGGMDKYAVSNGQKIRQAALGDRIDQIMMDCSTNYGNHLLDAPTGQQPYASPGFKFDDDDPYVLNAEKKMEASPTLGYKVFGTTIQLFKYLYRDTRIPQRVWVQILVRANCHQDGFVRLESRDTLCTIFKDVCSVTPPEDGICIVIAIYQVLIEELVGHLTGSFCLHTDVTEFMIHLLLDLLDNTKSICVKNQQRSGSEHSLLSAVFDRIESLGVFLLIFDSVDLRRSTLKLFRLIVELKFCISNTWNDNNILQVLLDPIPSIEFYENSSRLELTPNSYEHFLCDLGRTGPSFVESHYMGVILARITSVKPAISSIIWDQFQHLFVRISRQLKEQSLSFIQRGNKPDDDRVRCWGKIMLLATTNAARVECNNDEKEVDACSKGNQCHAENDAAISCEFVVLKELCQVSKCDDTALQKAAILALGNISVSLTIKVMDYLAELEAEAFPALGSEVQHTSKSRHDQEETSANSGKCIKLQLRLRWALIRTFRLIIEHLVEILPSRAEWISVEKIWHIQLRDRYSTILTECSGLFHIDSLPHSRKATTDTAMSYCLQSMIRQDFCAILSSVLQMEIRFAVEDAAKYPKLSHDHKEWFSMLAWLSASYHRDGESIDQHRKTSLPAINRPEVEDSDNDPDEYIVQTCVNFVREDNQDIRLYLSWTTANVKAEENQNDDGGTLAGNGSYTVNAGNTMESMDALLHEWILICLARTVRNQQRDEMLGSESFYKLLEIIDQCLTDEALYFNDTSQQRWFCHGILHQLVTFPSKLKSLDQHPYRNHILRSVAKKCLYSASPLSDKSSGQAYAIAIEYFYLLTRLLQSNAVNYYSSGEDKDRELCSLSDNLQSVMKVACILHAGDEYNWSIRQLAWDTMEFFSQHQESVRPFHGSSRARLLHIDLPIGHVVACIESRSISRFLSDLFGEKDAFDMCRIIGRFILCCDVNQQRKLLTALPSWANCINLSQHGSRHEVLLRLFLQMTSQLGSVFDHDLQHLWRSLAFPTHKSGSKADDSSNLILILHFMIDRSRKPGEFAIVRQLVAWLGRCQDSSQNLVAALITVIHDRQSKFWQQKTENGPERSKFIFVFDDAVTLIRMMTAVDAHLVVEATASHVTVEAESAVLLLHLTLGVLYFTLRSNQRMRQNTKIFSFDHPPAAPDDKEPQTIKISSFHADASLKSPKESSFFGADRMTTDCGIILQECLIVLRRLMRSETNWFQSLQIVISDRYDKNQSLDVIDNRFNQLLNLLIVVTTTQTQMIWDQICMSLVIQAISGTTSVKTSEAARVQGKQLTHFALRMYRILRRPFQGKMVLTILELLHKSLDPLVLCANEQNDVFESREGTSYTTVRASSESLVIECLITLASMISDVPVSKIALCPQIVWVTAALLNHCYNACVRLAAHNLLLSILSVPNILSVSVPGIQVLHDLVIGKCPEKWSAHQRSILRALLCCPPTFSSHPAIVATLKQRLRLCDILLQAVSIRIESQCTSLFRSLPVSECCQSTDAYQGSGMNQISTFMERTVQDQITFATLALLPHWLATSSNCHQHLSHPDDGKKNPMYFFDLAHRIQNTLVSAWSSEIAPYKAAELKKIFYKYNQPFAVSEATCREIVKALHGDEGVSLGGVPQLVSGSDFDELCIEVWMSHVSQCSDAFLSRLTYTEPDLYEHALLNASLLLLDSKLTYMLSSHCTPISEWNSVLDLIVKPLEHILHHQNHSPIWIIAVRMLSLISTITDKASIV
uniref:Uncharacterized protein AlNc14C1G151 n=1 Tax=Albugo laibachii Nc14 TaxID=890382 RepID=F0VZ04_9STRA|nr:conserved hypothetical protein [Albugo laibachii Nc14]|eukprot:CCA14019.1 conserved hypothetical protein [Albugo laibachii Nc14]